MKQKIRIIITIVTAVSLFFNVILPISKNWSRFTEKFNPKLYEKKYNQSQYVIPQSKTPISDEGIYAHAGYQYIKGINPILINSDHPPLGKYMIGLFTIITGNQRTIALFIGLSTLITMYLLTLFLTNSIALAILSILFLSLDTMFIDQIIYSPMLDSIQVLFLILFFFTFLIWEKKQKMRYLIISGIVFGFLSSVKMYFPALIILGVSSLYLLIRKKSIYRTVFVSVCILTTGFIIYLLSYSVFFIKGGTLISFFKSQKWIFLYWSQNAARPAISFGAIFPFILYNRWKIWWGDFGYIKYQNWSFFWPLFFITGVVSMFAPFLIKKSKIEKQKLFQSSLIYLSLWILFCLLYLAFVPISPRYLMLIFYPLYIIVTLAIKFIFPKYV